MENQNYGRHSTSITKHCQTSKSCQYAIDKDQDDDCTSKWSIQDTNSQRHFQYIQRLIKYSTERYGKPSTSLLADELDRYKGKENAYADNHIIEIQKVYQNKYQEPKQLEIVDKKNKKKKEYKMKNYSYTNLITYLSNPADLKCQNLLSFKMK